MTGLGALVKRNTKLYFRDKGVFITSLITPIILLVLYVSFLGNVYADTFRISFEAAGVAAPEKLISGCVGGQLVSSLLAVSCVTVAFCANLLMVQDKSTGARRDLTIAPLKRSTLALSYYVAAFISTLLICLITTAICFAYLANVGWYMSAMDVGLILVDVAILALFGTAISSCVNFPLSTSGQGSAVGTIISAGYGFICGAYMPISQFPDGMQKAISFLPGTYGTSLIRNHAMRGVFAQMDELGLPNEAVQAIKDSVDANLYFFGDKVSISSMYIVLIASILVGIGLYTIMGRMNRKNA